MWRVILSHAPQSCDCQRKMDTRQEAGANHRARRRSHGLGINLHSPNRPDRSTRNGARRFIGARMAVLYQADFIGTARYGVRIDKEGHRFAVAEIPTASTTGAEAFGATSVVIRTNARMLARFFIGRHTDLAAGQQGDDLETFEFEMFEVERRSQPTSRFWNSS